MRRPPIPIGLASAMKKGKITIIDPESGEERDVEHEFIDAETQRLRDFVAFTRELIDTQYFKEDRQASLEVKWDDSKGVRVEPYAPAAEVCDALLFRLRPFVLRVEPTFFPSVCSLIGKRVQDPLIHKVLRGQNDQWQGKHFRSIFKVSDNFGILNSDKSVMDYLNGFEYHRDAEKRERLEPTRKFFGDVGLRALFLLLIADKARAIMTIGALCEFLLGARKTIVLRTEAPVRDAS